MCQSQAYKNSYEKGIFGDCINSRKHILTFITEPEEGGSDVKHKVNNGLRIGWIYEKINYILLNEP